MFWYKRTCMTQCRLDACAKTTGRRVAMKVVKSGVRSDKSEKQFYTAIECKLISQTVVPVSLYYCSEASYIIPQFLVLSPITQLRFELNTDNNIASDGATELQ